MMMEHNLKACPFCGGQISLEAVIETQQERRVHMRCSGCGMEFIHRQAFAFSKQARMAIGHSFEETWNERADQ